MYFKFKVMTGSDDPDVKVFEHLLSFPGGFVHYTVPSSIGEGTVTNVEMDPELIASVQQYKLNAPLEVTYARGEGSANSLYIVFYSLVVPKTESMRINEFISEPEGVNIYTDAIDLTLLFPANTVRNVVVIQTTRRRIEALLGEAHQGYLNELLQLQPSFFMHELMTGEMRRELQLMKSPPDAPALVQFFYHTHLLQLIYLILVQLNKRSGTVCRTTDPELIARIFKVRALLVADLSEPPTIAVLAREVLVSESQLKQSFREIFGASIYQYFQHQRLEKARQLLSTNLMTVSEVGYELGFTNIGHFSRLFERAFRVKPKRYQLDMAAAAGEQGE